MLYNKVTMRIRKKHSLLFLALWLIVFGVAKLEPGWFEQPAQTLQQSQPGLYEVEEDTDGDTIIVNMNGTREIVRFIGVDTPETHKPNTPVQCYGPEAAEYTRKAVEGKR